MKTADEILIDTVQNEIHEHLGDATIFSLPWKKQVVALVLGADKYISNGGFIYFFEGDWKEQPPYSVWANAFRAIGDDESAECIEAAASLFPFPEPHLNGKARRDYLRKHCMIEDRSNWEVALVKLGNRVNEEKYYPLLAQYIRNNLEEIRRG